MLVTVIMVNVPFNAALYYQLFRVAGHSFIFSGLSMETR